MRKASLIALLWLALPAWALNPPHDSSNTISCLTCHTPHGTSTNLALISEDSVSKLCLTCHVPGGLADPKPFNDADQAYPGITGTSHRWDSGPAGHVERGTPNTSTGLVSSTGTFTGRIEDTYVITISTGGDVGTARFGWTSTYDGSGSNILTASTVTLGTRGLTLTFADGTAAPAFVQGDRWNLYVRTDLVMPTDPPEALFSEQMSTRMPGEKIICSTCHDQHDQVPDPWDPFGPGVAYDPPAPPADNNAPTGTGRKYQRRDNDSGQLCLVCHAPRNVTSAAQGSHAVGITIPSADPRFKSPAALPLDSSNRIQCLTCHAPHYADSGGANSGAGDGYILRTGMGVICLSCHTNTTDGDSNAFANTSTGSHFNATTGALWGGSNNGSTFPALPTTLRGACVNCHWPHGWDDDNNASATADFPRLWVEQYDVSRTGKTDPNDGEDLCLACHTGGASPGTTSPATSNIEAEFAKGSALATATGLVYRHPVADNEQTPLPAGRAVECVDCHDPHKATATNRLAGVSGVDLAGTPVTLGAGTDDAEQAQLCYKCHGDSFNSARNNTSNKRLDFNTAASNSGYHPVSQAGRGQSANLNAQLLGGLTTSSTLRCTDCHNSNAANNSGPVTDTTALTYGPHGSTNAYILRGTFNTSYTSTGWNSTNNAGLCFLCHNSTRLFGSNSNFSDSADPAGSKGKGNLHAYHLTNKGVTSSCMSCHYDIHSNRTASNTQYRVLNGGTQTYLGTTPPPNVKSHLVNFAPDVTALSHALPRWQIDTATGVRTCDLTCHGSSDKMQNVTYRVSSGDETSHTY